MSLSQRVWWLLKVTCLNRFDIELCCGAADVGWSRVDLAVVFYHVLIHRWFNARLSSQTLSRHWYVIIWGGAVQVKRIRDLNVGPDTYPQDQTHEANPMLPWCWATVADGGPTLGVRLVLLDMTLCERWFSAETTLCSVSSRHPMSWNWIIVT